jgi:hypothetical protein
VLARGVHRVHADDLRLAILKERHQLAGLQQFRRQVGRQHRDAGAGSREAHQARRIVGRDVAATATDTGSPLSLRVKFQRLRPKYECVRQLRWASSSTRSGLPCSFRYAGEAHTTERQVGEPPRDQVRIDLRRHADRQVDALVHQVHRPVEQHQVDRHGRIAPHVVGHRVGQLRLRERGAAGDAQLAARRLGRMPHGGLHVAREFEHLAAARQQFLAGGGEAQAARGAVQKARAGPLLQFGHVARDHRAGHVQLFGRGRQAARIHHVHEHPHCVQSVHSNDFRNKEARISRYFFRNQKPKMRFIPSTSWSHS